MRLASLHFIAHPLSASDLIAPAVYRNHTTIMALSSPISYGERIPQKALLFNANLTAEKISCQAGNLLFIKIFLYDKRVFW